MDSRAVTEEKKYIVNRFFAQEKMGPEAVFNTLSASYLRFEALLGTSAEIEFNVQSNLGTVLASEMRLKQTDQFIITHLGFCIKKIAAAAPTAAQQAVAKLYTWVNTNTGLFDGTNDANLQAIYNGFFDISVNRKTYVPAIDMRSFERVPDMQEGQPLAAIAGPVTYALKRDSFPNGLFGYFPVDYIRLNGFDQIQPTITLPASVAMAEANESNYAVLLCKGYLAANMGNSKSLGDEQQ